MIGGILLNLAYLIVSYLFITNPMASILMLALYLAILFALGSIAHLLADYTRRRLLTNWLIFIISVLDLIMAWMLIGSGPIASVNLVLIIVSIEMLIKFLQAIRNC